jgi:hypothetical protein
MDQLRSVGWRFYRRPRTDDADCQHLRPLEDHVGYFVRLITEVLILDEARVSLGRAAVDDWPLIEQWLRMAAGLEHVAVDLASFDAPYMCSTAMDWREAADRLASLYTTEYTRLLYAWNATERFLKSLNLPEVPEARGPFNAATSAIARGWHGPLPDHYEGIVRHLKTHVDPDPSLAGNEQLSRAFEETGWRSRGGILLAAAHQLRHPPAHGALAIPGPKVWGRDRPEVERLPSALHIPRLGVRSLILSLQMLLVMFLPPSLRFADHQAPLDGWAVRDAHGDWTEPDEPVVAHVLLNAHLRPEA